MNYSEIIVGHSVLVQSDASVRERAKVMGVSVNGRVIVCLANGEITEMSPEYIIKDFEV